MPERKSKKEVYRQYPNKNMRCNPKRRLHRIINIKYFCSAGLLWLVVPGSLYIPVAEDYLISKRQLWNN